MVAEPKVRVNQRIRAPKLRGFHPKENNWAYWMSLMPFVGQRNSASTWSKWRPAPDPPVCKNYGLRQVRYEESKKEHERKKKQAIVVVKEIKLRPKTEEHDLDYKVKRLKRFIAEDCR